MTKFLRKTFTVGLLIASFVLAGCASTKAVKATVPGMSIEKFDDAMCWKLTNAEKNSSVYILGTFHLADERAYPFPEDVLQGLAKANRLVGELSLEDFQSIAVKYNELMQNSGLAMNGIEGDLTDYLTEEESAILFGLLTEDYFGIYIQLEPWVSTFVLSSAIYAGSGFSAEYGYDVNLYSLAAQNGVNVEGLENPETQLNILSYGNFEEQITLLKQTLEGFKNYDELIATEKNKYETYLTHDDVKMEELLFGGIKEIIKEYPVFKDYYIAMFDERNEKWAHKIAEYLNEEGSTTFIFAGIGHFIGENSVFKFMMEQGSL